MYIFCYLQRDADTGFSLSAILSLDQNVGLGAAIGVSGQSANQISTVLSLQLVDITEVQSTVRASVYAGRVLALSTQVSTSVALGDLHGFLVYLRSAVRASQSASAAADAQVQVTANSAVLGLMHSLGRTCSNTSGILAVVAGVGQVVHLNGGEGTYFVGLSVTQNYANTQIVFVFTSYLACSAADAASHIKIKT